MSENWTGLIVRRLIKNLLQKLKKMNIRQLSTNVLHEAVGHGRLKNMLFLCQAFWRNS